jgi:hypothetical protein
MAEKPLVFDEDRMEGAMLSLQRTTRRIQWRTRDGVWPNEPIGKLREAMEDEIDRLIAAEIEKYRRNEVTAQERTGPVIHSRRRGQMRMTPKKPAR